VTLLSESISLHYNLKSPRLLADRNQRARVFEGAFRIRQQLKVNSMAEFSVALGADGKKVTVKGTLEYQACDSKICFLAASVPVDRQRAPEDIRHS
jgi:hypothetical protein